MASYQADATYDRQYIDRIGEKDVEITYVQAVDEWDCWWESEYLGQDLFGLMKEKKRESNQL